MIPAALSLSDHVRIRDIEDDEPWCDEMAWATPQFSKAKVNAAGEVLVRGALAEYAGPGEYWTDYFKALDVVNNWRASHSFPLNTLTVGLKQRSKRIDPKCITAQRIKRLSSIEYKLGRFETMTLAQMQDIGGCRAVMASVPAVTQLVRDYRNSQIKHQLAQCDDYIATPKESGYRGVHLIYKYYSDRKKTYNSLRIELQIRTHLQHAWATAVETVGTLQQQALKSSQGEQEWLRFFALTSSAFAFREGTNPVPGTPDSYRIMVEELREHVGRLDLTNRLTTYGHAMKYLANPQHGKGDSHFFLLEMNPSQKTIEVTTFKWSESKLANDKYLEVEKKLRGSPGAEAVLVAVDSLETVRKAYPNYFLDTQVFMTLVDQVTKSLRPPRRARQRPEKRQLRLF